ncbi:MAG: cytochrome c biogenesis protein CcdA [Terriglobia bacterium]
MAEINLFHIGIAFLGGVFSFLSPCVLPLVPGYISLMSGVSVEKLKQGEGATGAVAARALLFILGFSVVFVGMGASASAVGAFLTEYRSVLLKIAGAIIIVFGLFLLGALKISALYREKRYHGDVGRGKAGTFLLGLAFAFGWTPCVGPILAALLALAATRETVTQGVLLLSVYSLGLGLPFLLTALGINKFLAFYQGFRRHLLWVERFAGVLLIGVGILVLTNQLTWLSGYFARLPLLDRLNLEEALADSAGGEFEVTSNLLPPEQRALAPNLALERADGSTLRLSELRGQVVVVNLWATWCAPCRAEIPYFNTTYEKYRAQGVVFLGVSVDEGGWPAIEEFQQELPLAYPVVLDRKGELWGAFESMQSLPVTVFVDREGRVASTHIGITDVDTLQANIEALL